MNSPIRKTPGDTAWFMHDRFGMFIHFGLYAMAARHEWIKSYECIPEEKYDIIFSSGVFHYIKPEKRFSFIEQLKNATNPGGIHLINAFVEKPFIAPPPDAERAEFENGMWKSGELFTAYHNWLLHKTSETIFDCMSSGVPHQHCMDIVIAQKP